MKEIITPIFIFEFLGIGFGYTCHRLISIGEKGVADIFLDAADLITIVIPPALPAAMTIGNFYCPFCRFLNTNHFFQIE